jgi:hypothetical protein
LLVLEWHRSWYPRCTLRQPLSFARVLCERGHYQGELPELGVQAVQLREIRLGLLWGSARRRSGRRGWSDGRAVAGVAERQAAAVLSAGVGPNLHEVCPIGLPADVAEPSRRAGLEVATELSEDGVSHLLEELDSSVLPVFDQWDMTPFIGAAGRAFCLESASQDPVGRPPW